METTLWVGCLLVACGGETQISSPVDGAVAPDSAPEASTTEASADSGSSLPVIPDALVWLEADLGMNGGGLVMSWKDQSGSNNNAIASDPTSPSLSPNGLNGRPVVVFTGTSYLSLPSGFSDFTKGLSAFVVCKPAVAAHPANLAARLFDFAPAFGSLTDSILFVRYWPNGQDLLMYQVYAGGAPGPNVGATGAFTDDVWQELSVVAPAGNAGTGVSATLYKNAAVIATSSVLVPNVLDRQSNFIGKSNLSADPLFKGQLAALVIFKRALTALEREAMDAYLKKKWAF